MVAEVEHIEFDVVSILEESGIFFNHDQEKTEDWRLWAMLTSMVSRDQDLAGGFSENKS